MNVTIQQVVHHQHDYPPVRTVFDSCVHDCHVISFHYRAAGQCILGTESLVMDKPACLLLAAGEEDQNGLVGRDEAYWCLFTGDLVRAQPGGRTVQLKTDRINICRSHARRLNADECAWFLEQFQTLHALARAPDMPSGLRATAKLMEILAAWSAPTHGDRGNEDRLVQRYRILIEQHANDAQTALASLARQIGMTPNHLAALFRREWGMSPVEYRTRIRLFHAEQLLLSTTLSVAEIAREVGFPDPAYFTRVFHRTHRMGPREFARKRRLCLRAARVSRRMRSGSSSPQRHEAEPR